MNIANINEVWERTVVVQEMLLVCGVVGKCSVRGCFGRKDNPGHNTQLFCGSVPQQLTQSSIRLKAI